MVRNATSADLDFVYRLYMHPLVNPFLLYDPMPREEFVPIFTDLLEKKVKYIFLAGDRPVGMFKLIPYTYRASHIAYLGGLAIDPAVGGKGYGHKMLQEILAFFREKGFERIELSVATINEKAIRLYEKLGFIKEGVLRKYTRLKQENRYLDEVLMAHLF